MGFWGFWFQCARRALRVSLLATDRLDFAVSVGVTGVASLFGWQIDWNVQWPVIALAVLGAGFLARLFVVAPYQLWKEQEAKAIAATGALAQITARSAEASERTALLSELGNLQASGVVIRNAGRQDLDDAAFALWEREVLEWELQTIAALKKLHEPTGIIFGTLNMVPSPALATAATREEQRALYAQHDLRVLNLGKILERWTAPR